MEEYSDAGFLDFKQVRQFFFWNQTLDAPFLLQNSHAPRKEELFIFFIIDFYIYLGYSLN